MIVLDTHVLLWWASGQTHQLSAPARQALDAETAAGKILVSAISAWEIAMLVARNRLALAMEVSDWLSTVARIPWVELVPVDRVLGVDSVQLPGKFHRDPADRLIVATARARGCPLVTADQKIRDYPHVRILW